MHRDQGGITWQITYQILNLLVFSDARAKRDDLIACEVDFDGATDHTIPVVFFLNGREITHASMKCAAGQARPFPYISMGIKGIQVLAQVR